MHDMGTNILFRAFCALADGTASVINSSLKHFSDEFEAHVRLGRRSARRFSEPPAGGGVVSETGYAHHRRERGDGPEGNA